MDKKGTIHRNLGDVMWLIKYNRKSWGVLSKVSQVCVRVRACVRVCAFVNHKPIAWDIWLAIPID